MGSPLPMGWTLPEEIRARLGDQAGRQRAMLAEDHLLVILHEPVSPPGQPQRGRIFWRDPQGNWKSNTNANGLMALKQHAQEFMTEITRLDERLDAANSADDYFNVLQAIQPLHRAARNTHAALQQAREMVPADRDLIVARDQSVEIERAAELLHGDARNAMEYAQAKQAESQAQLAMQMSAAAHRLNVLVAVFFPIATLSAIFGMNLHSGIVSNDNPRDFWIVVVVGFIVGWFLKSLVSLKPATKPKRDDRRINNG